ncbi:pre-rRNA-processing protein esf1 [Fusarium torreyae]|uniref:Pre-rRNA-processing protein esf1 n=1 Tax=Fusarium torreyae TaxID=1237075 RepID=A0A9W8VIY8_9HYPO|nr:pre-rRNA-processing protein esf1 [Fusarium torreyae]
MKSEKKTKKGGPSASRIADDRFADFETDPRFRLPSKKQTKTTIDKRFARMLNDDEFTATAKVDRYGRKVKSDSKKKALQRLYREEDEEDDEGGDDIEVDDDEVVQRELRKAHEKYDPARGGGFSSSESDSESEEEEEDSESDEEEGGAQVDTEGDMQRFQDEQNEVEAGEVTNRIAIVNLDWDHVKSTDLMALFDSFLPDTGGKIDKISVYPSEFGKERMQQEEVEGPPKELFKNSKNDDSDEDSEDSDEDSEEDDQIKKDLLQEGDDQDFDSDALRSYQLDRLRYYYAVMVCSSPAVAQKLYEAVDGREYQSSSNFLDLRFVPDDVTFDDEPRDECEKVPESYKPVEFVTNALQSSKVKLTWDMHPEEASRKESINRAFSGSRNEIEENDLRAYLASDSEDSDDAEEVEEAAEEKGEDEPKLSKKELARRKMRAALGLSEETTKSSKNAPVGDMEITFTPALTESAPKKTAEEETTIEKYVRKEKERKEKKREAARARRAGLDPEAEESEDEVVEAPEGATDDLGFDDPFFTAEEPAASSKTSIRKADRLKKREAREAAEAETKAQKKQLESVMADAGEDQADHLDHFDMNEIVRAEKAKRKKGKAKKKAESKADRGGLQQDFDMDVGDDRFKAVFESHEYAIDPSNPKFKATEGMKKLLEEGRKKRRVADGEDEAPRTKKVKKVRR